MKRTLNDFLREREQVFWQGEPAPFPYLEKGTKFPILGKWILTPLVTLGFLVVYYHYNVEPSTAFAAAVVVIAAVIMSGPILERRKVLGQKYFITDQRAIVQLKDGSFRCMELDKVDDFRIISDLSDEETLVLGGILFPELCRQMRWRTCHPKDDIDAGTGANAALGLIFYGVKNAAAAEELLRRRGVGHAA